MSDAPHFFPFHIGDYLRDTRGLSVMEHGAYLLLMLEYYSSAKPLPADVSTLYKITGARTHSEQAAVRRCVSKFFTNGNAELIQPRIVRELQRWETRTRKARTAANAKWNKAQPDQGPDDASAADKKDANASAEQSSEHAPPSSEQCEPIAYSLKPLAYNTPPFPPAGGADGENEFSPKAKTKKPPRSLGRWWLSEKGIEAKARELGMWPAHPGESAADFKNRLLSEDRKRRPTP